MAGFLGLFNYAKPGKGVDKNGPEKKRFFLFWELVARKFWKLIQLNLIYILFCIPVVTIGPATAAMYKVLKSFATEKPVFLWSDFVDAFKSDFKQSFAMGLINIFVYVVATFAIYFYYKNGANNQMFYIPMIVGLSAMLIYVIMNFYTYLMIAVVADMSFKTKVKNSFCLAVVGMKTNLLTFLFVAITVATVWWYMPVGAIATIVCLLAFVHFIIVFNSYPVVDKHVLSPYYEQTGERRPDEYYYDEYEEDALLFADIGTEEIAVQAEKKIRGKTIQ